MKRTKRAALKKKNMLIFLANFESDDCWPKNFWTLGEGEGWLRPRLKRGINSVLHRYYWFCERCRKKGGGESGGWARSTPFSGWFDIKQGFSGLRPVYPLTLFLCGKPSRKKLMFNPAPSYRLCSYFQSPFRQRRNFSIP